MKLIIPAIIAIVLLPMRIAMKEATLKAIQKDLIWRVLLLNQQKTRADLIAGLLYVGGYIGVYVV